MNSSGLLRIGMLSLALLAPMALAGCSGLRPVYGETGITQGRVLLSYAKPATRIDQIVIQDLILRLGSTQNPDAPEVTVRTAVSSRQLTRTGVEKPATQQEITVTASYSIVSGDKTVLEGSRRASASYATSGQVLADEAAAKDATERAAHEVAEMIRLNILGRLAAPVPAALQ